MCRGSAPAERADPGASTGTRPLPMKAPVRPRALTDGGDDPPGRRVPVPDQGVTFAV